MRFGIWIIISASAAAVIAGVSAAAAVSAGAASTPGGATPVQKTIEVANNPGEEVAPPPADAAPKLTGQQALDAYTGKSNFQVPDGVSVALGRLTRPIGPDCGPNCEKGDTVLNRIAYDVYKRLAYGFMVNRCPAGSTAPDWQCQQWLFLDANTGQEIGNLGPAPAGGAEGPQPTGNDQDRSADRAAQLCPVIPPHLRGQPDPCDQGASAAAHRRFAPDGAEGTGSRRSGDPRTHQD